MKPEQKIGIVFSALGAAMGVLSTYIGTLVLAIVIPIVAYVAMLFLASRMERSKKMKWFVTNSVISFLLVWLVVWIFVFNTG